MGFGASTWPDFPSFSEGLSLRDPTGSARDAFAGFPFLFGGTFIEGWRSWLLCISHGDFPSFSEGLSLRRFDDVARKPALGGDFPSFLEGLSLRQNLRGLLGHYRVPFPFLLGRAFIEAVNLVP